MSITLCTLYTMYCTRFISVLIRSGGPLAPPYSVYIQCMLSVRKIYTVVPTQKKRHVLYSLCMYMLSGLRRVWSVLLRVVTATVESTPWQTQLANLSQPLHFSPNHITLCLDTHAAHGSLSRSRESSGEGGSSSPGLTASCEGLQGLSLHRSEAFL